MSEKTHSELIAEQLTNIERLGDELPSVNAAGALRKLLRHLDEAHGRKIDALKQRCAELDAEVAAKDEVIKRLNDAIAEEQRRKMATPENSSAVGNAAKLRKAMIEVLEYIETFHKYITPGKGKRLTALFAVADTIRDKARAALAAPPRQCDVGTVEEQAQRMADFCERHYKKAAPGRHICSACKFHNKDAEWECYFSWAQMPYESEAAK